MVPTCPEGGRFLYRLYDCVSYNLYPSTRCVRLRGEIPAGWGPPDRVFGCSEGEQVEHPNGPAAQRNGHRSDQGAFSFPGHHLPCHECSRLVELENEAAALQHQRVELERELEQLRPLRVLDVERMLTTEPPPVPWVAEPLLARGCVTLLAGREGQGKSMLALALSAAIGHGATVAGLRCLPGRALIVDAENGQREVHRRVHGLDVKRETLAYAEAVGFDLATDIEEITELVGANEPTVLVLDSLRSLAPGLDENDSRAAEAALRPVSRLAQERDIPVLLLHHAGKRGHEYRGSTAIGAAVEIGFTLSRHEDDPDRRRRRLTCWKCRPAPEPAARWLTLEATEGSVVIAEAEPFRPERQHRQDDRRERVRDALSETPQSVRAIADAADVSKTTADRILRALAEDGDATQTAVGWVSHVPDPLGDGTVEQSEPTLTRPSEPRPARQP